MILRVIIDNLFSFGQQTEFNMFTNKSQKHLDHKRYLGKVAYLKMAAIYGANGAGKSNMIKSLGLLQALVTSGIVPAFVENLKFKLDKDCLERCSSLAVEFVTVGHIYYYTISFDNAGVYYETLTETLQAGKDRLIFEREFDDGKEKVSFYEGYEKTPTNKLFVEMLADKFLGRKEVLLHLLQEKYGEDFPETKEAFAWFANTLHIIHGMQAISSSIAHEFGGNEKLLNFGNSIVSKLSTGVEGIQTFAHEVERTDKNEDIFKALENDPNSVVNRFNPYTGEQISYAKDGDKVVAEVIRTKHSDKEGNDVNFTFGMESDGTMRLVDYIPMLSDILKNQAVYVIDEIERSIHPAVIKELVRLIAANRDMNGQLVFSTHETCLLDQAILRTDEIWFAQKNVFGSTDLYSLSDFNVHATANVENGYLNGRYGGIPFMNELKTLHWDEGEE